MTCRCHHHYHRWLRHKKSPWHDLCFPPLDGLWVSLIILHTIFITLKRPPTKYREFKTLICGLSLRCQPITHGSDFGVKFFEWIDAKNRKFSHFYPSSAHLPSWHTAPKHSATCFTPLKKGYIVYPLIRVCSMKPIKPSNWNKGGLTNWLKVKYALRWGFRILIFRSLIVQLSVHHSTCVEQQS